jgi:hypothetical protein
VYNICLQVVADKSQCVECLACEKALKARLRRKKLAAKRPLNKFTPLKNAAHNKVVEALKTQRQVRI